MTAPLAGCRIIITRAADQAVDLARALGDLGATTEELATLRIVPTEHMAELDAALAQRLPGGWWVFTSANGVKAVAARLKGGWPTVVKLAAVGTATARVLAEVAGREPDVVPVRHDGEHLARAIATQQSPPAPMLVLRGNLASNVLPRALADAGFAVTEVEAYRTERALADAGGLSARLRAGEIDWLTFASGSAFQNLLMALDDPKVLGRARLASIGPRTSDVIQHAGFVVGAEALQATSQGLAEAIAAAQNATDRPSR
jgi:uroporphyrinogen III methyltransferase/synthase